MCDFPFVARAPSKERAVALEMPSSLTRQELSSSMPAPQRGRGCERAGGHVDGADGGAEGGAADGTVDDAADGALDGADDFYMSLEPGEGCGRPIAPSDVMP